MKQKQKKLMFNYCFETGIKPPSKQVADLKSPMG
jgi:hypothetical protein